MRTEVIEGITNVDASIWDKLTLGFPFTSTVWCKYSELYEQEPTHYALVYDDERAVGGAIFQISHHENLPTTYKFVYQAVNQYLKRRPLIVCRSPLETFYGGIFLPEDKQLRQQVLDKLQEVAHQLAKKYHASFILVDYLDEEILNGDWPDFVKLYDFAYASNVLHVQWQTYDEYLQYIRSTSKKRLKNIRYSTRQAEEMGIRLEFSAQIVSKEDYLRLRAANFEIYDLAYASKEAEKFLDCVESGLPDKNKIWVTAYHNNKIVACELLIFDDINHICKPIFYGRDYSVEQVYFYLAYQDIRYAIEELKAEVINYGTHANEFKRRLGFEPASLNHLVFYPNSLISKLLVKILQPFMNN